MAMDLQANRTRINRLKRDLRTRLIGRPDEERAQVTIDTLIALGEVTAELGMRVVGNQEAKDLLIQLAGQIIAFDMAAEVATDGPSSTLNPYA